MPTILGACGVEAPEVVDGASQQPFDGASFAASFDDADAPAARQVQYFEMLGSRSIVSGDWKATTNHVSEGVVDEEELMEGKIGRTSCRENVVSTCKSRWSPDH